MPPTGNILIIDDDWDVLRAAQLLLKRHFARVDGERNPQQIPFLLNNNRYDVILLDMNFTRDRSSGKEGFEWLDRILDIDRKAVVVLFTAYGDVEMAVRAIKAGAADFVLKPWENEKLLTTVRTAMDLAGTGQENESGAGSNETGPDGEKAPDPIIGESPAMLQVLDTAEKIAGTEANILILGENGTGKDLLARYIHQLSGRSAQPFVSADMGAIPET
ncbi:MAG TPA: response regulator, partial [Anseongella sp.]|nr:response regulator [Anseongella sp.]